jgi:hypothetical protein
MHMTTTTTFELIVETLAYGRFALSIESHDDEASLVASAAEYWAGEYPGRVAGAFVLTFNHNRSLIATAQIANLDAKIADALNGNAAWEARQRELAREDHRRLAGSRLS